MASQEPEVDNPGPAAPSTHPQVQEQMTEQRATNEQSGHVFFAFLSFFIALILLAVFLTSLLDGLTRLVVLFGVIVFGMIGMRLLEHHPLMARFLGQEREDDPSAVSQAPQQEDETPLSETLTPFEVLVQEALGSIPDEFHEQMENLGVFVENEPDEETLERLESEEGSLLLGLYQGTPLTVQGYQRALYPERITLYQHNIELICHHDPVRIREQVRHTLLHEIAHHFGMDHEEMPIWIK